MPATSALILLEDMLAGGEARSRRYQNPAGSVTCSDREGLAAFFGQIQSWQRAQLAVLLLLAYEFGNLLDAAASTAPIGARPFVAQALAFESALAGTTRD